MAGKKTNPKNRTETDSAVQTFSYSEARRVADEYVHLRIPAKLKEKLQAIAQANYKTLTAYCIEAMVEKARRDGHDV